MSTLKVNKLRDTAGSADAITLDPNGGAVLAGVTTVTSVKVGAAVTISESGIEASGIGITCANINGTQIGGRRNIIINGDMNIAQRGTSSTSAGYQTVDRFTTSMAGTDEACTFAQVDVASGTTPYTEGFRKAFKVTNGNQTSGAGAADDVSVSQHIEGQNLAQSGWDYTSSSSFITLSFWVKSSVAQTFFAGIRLYGDDQREFCFSYTVTADTWTKVIKSIPGAAGLTIVNTNALGAFIQWPQWWGTNYTSSGRALDTWQVKNNASNYPDNTTTWYTTNDATWELTGVQLEVGSQATPFEHRSFGEEQKLCKRYYQIMPAALMNIRGSDSVSYSNASLQTTHVLPEPMRSTPTGSNATDGTDYVTMKYYSASYGSEQDYEAYFNIGIHAGTVRFNFAHNQTHNSGNSLGTTYKWGISQDPAAFDAEL